MPKQRGKPILTLRLSPETITALRISANRHGLTVSDLIRQLIHEQLKADGITASSEPLPGQITM